MQKRILFIFNLGIFVFLHCLYAQTWDPVRRLTWSSTNASTPSTVVDSSGTIHLVWQHEIGIDSNDHVHVFWEDSSSGAFEIFYRRGKQ